MIGKQLKNCSRNAREETKLHPRSQIHLIRKSWTKKRLDMRVYDETIIRGGIERPATCSDILEKWARVADLRR